MFCLTWNIWNIWKTCFCHGRIVKPFRHVIVYLILISTVTVIFVYSGIFIDNDSIVVIGNKGSMDEETKLKLDSESQLILFWTSFHLTPHRGYTMIIDGNKKCIFTADKSQLEESALVIFYFHFGGWMSIIKKKEPIIPPVHPPSQRWVYYHREPASLVTELRFDLALQFGNSFNAIASHMTESDIKLPYGSYRRLSEEEKVALPPNTNYAEGRSNLAMAMVSNCGPGRDGYYDNGRMDFLLSVKKLVSLDIFGDCGDKFLPFSCWNQCDNSAVLGCFTGLAAKYKFIFSLENSDCDDYITEKYWQNALLGGMVPVVRGKRSNYEHIGVPGSFIHADIFGSLQELADYLHVLDRNITMYNEYFAWQQEYHVETHWSNCNRDYTLQDVAFCRYAHDQRNRPLKWLNVSAFIEKPRRCHEN